MLIDINFVNAMNDILSYIASIAGALGVASTIVYAVIKYIHDFFERKAKAQDEYLSSFNRIVAQLNSKNRATQLTAAVLLRRYLSDTKKYVSLKSEAIHTISSLARVLPTGVLQKTLVDGLAYVKDLTKCDLQKANLQDAYIGVKEGKIVMNNTDLFLSDLSYALLQNVIGHDIILYRAILLGAQIKDCDFSNGNFAGADLTNATFKNVILEGADFSGAYNIPDNIKSNLVDGVYRGSAPVTARHISSGKSIFFSMPGKIVKDREVITKEYKRILESRGYDVIYYNRDVYPSYGQFNRVREAINRSAGIIAFGFRQINIHSATYRPNTDEAEEWSNVWLSTPWSDIEVGMGLMKGLPILMVTDSEINSGVFDKGLTECYVANISSELDCKSIEQNPCFDEWISKL